MRIGLLAIERYGVFVIALRPDMFLAHTPNMASIARSGDDSAVSINHQGGIVQKVNWYRPVVAQTL